MTNMATLKNGNDEILILGAALFPQSPQNFDNWTIEHLINNGLVCKGKIEIAGNKEYVWLTNKGWNIYKDLIYPNKRPPYRMMFPILKDGSLTVAEIEITH